MNFILRGSQTLEVEVIPSRDLFFILQVPIIRPKEKCAIILYDSS